MKNIKILAPIKSIEDISSILKTNCRSIYIYHYSFLENNNYKNLLEYILKAKELNIQIFINFKNVVNEDELELVKNLIDFLKKQDINGILVNSLAVLELIKNVKLPFKVFIDSGLNIHNLAGIEFVNLFNKIESINITDEIYVKNVEKLKKYSKHNISIDSDHFPWIAQDIIKSKSINTLIIKGEFDSSKKLVEGIKLIESIIENPKSFKSKKLPFKNKDSLCYKSNHFSKEFFNMEGKNFKFSGNIKQFSWNLKRTRLIQKPKPNFKLPHLNLKLTSLEQLSALKKYIKKHKFNPVYSIEYGEILNTADLARYSFDKIIDKVKKDCYEYGISLQLSTPKILNERDFDRVYEYVKLLCTKNHYPSEIIVNNIGYWWTIINDPELNNTNLELGQGLNILNSASISCLLSQHDIHTIDFSNFKSLSSAKSCIEIIKDRVPNRKITIAGNIRIPSYGLCPLNNDLAILSRLSCSAPCHKGNYAISDPNSERMFSIAVDGFCRMHLFRDKILDLFKHVKTFESIGINEFSIDFNSLSANLIPILLNKFINSYLSESYIPDTDFVTNAYRIE